MGITLLKEASLILGSLLHKPFPMLNVQFMTILAWLCSQVGWLPTMWFITAVFLRNKSAQFRWIALRKLDRPRICPTFPRSPLVTAATVDDVRRSVSIPAIMQWCSRYSVDDMQMSFHIPPNRQPKQRTRGLLAIWTFVKAAPSLHLLLFRRGEWMAWSRGHYDEMRKVSSSEQLGCVSKRLEPEDL